MTAEEIRLELVRRRQTRVSLARDLGLTYDYVCKILSGYRHAELRRLQITHYFHPPINKNMRGVS